MQIVFFGTPQFAIPSLKALLASSNKVLAVVTQSDKRRGRLGLPSPTPVKEFAIKENIRVLQPEKINVPSFIDELSFLNPDIIVVVAYGKILPPRILNLPCHGCINVHASLLPKYRGAAPIQWAIIKGEKETGVTTMLMNEGLDTGDVLLQESIEILDNDNSETLGKKLSELGASLLVKTIEGLESGSLKPVPQQGKPSYAPILKKQDGRINWDMNASDIWNFVRGMYPWPGAFTKTNNERIKIINVRPIQGKGIPGRIESVSNRLVIGTGDGLIEILEIQPEGKRIMNSKDFIIGRRLKEGDFFDNN